MCVIHRHNLIYGWSITRPSREWSLSLHVAWLTATSCRSTSPTTVAHCVSTSRDWSNFMVPPWLKMVCVNSWVRQFLEETVLRVYFPVNGTEYKDLLLSQFENCRNSISALCTFATLQIIWMRRLKACIQRHWRLNAGLKTSICPSKASFVC